MTTQVPATSSAKILLDVMSALLQLPQVTIVERALVAYLNSLEPKDKIAIEGVCGRATQRREELLSEAAQQTASTGQPRTTYEFSRFCFKRDRIEGIGWEDEFRMITPIGVFQMTKADFYREFPKVVESESYKNGIYHYPKLPSKAERFRV
jgi:hypothetical protein